METRSRGEVGRFVYLFMDLVNRDVYISERVERGAGVKYVIPELSSR